MELLLRLVVTFQFNPSHLSMPAKDLFHQAVRHALEKEGWIITYDPLHIRPLAELEKTS